jgi:hypothetical protein
MNKILPVIRHSDQGPTIRNLYFILFFIKEKLHDGKIDALFANPGFVNAFRAEATKIVFPPLLVLSPTKNGNIELLFIN